MGIVLAPECKNKCQDIGRYKILLSPRHHLSCSIDETWPSWGEAILNCQILVFLPSAFELGCINLDWGNSISLWKSEGLIFAMIKIEKSTLSLSPHPHFQNTVIHISHIRGQIHQSIDLQGQTYNASFTHFI